MKYLANLIIANVSRLKVFKYEIKLSIFQNKIMSILCTYLGIPHSTTTYIKLI